MCREGADRAIDDVWVGRVFLLGGLVQDACCCGRHSPFTVRPPLSCCKIIFTVLDHAAAGAGGRRLQEETGVEQGQPPTPQTSPNGSCSPNSQRPWYCQWFPRLSCRWQWRLWTPHTQPLDLVQHVMFLFPPQVSWFSPRGPCYKPRSCPLQHRIPSLKNKVFFAHLCGMSWSWKVARVGLDVDSAQAG